MTVYYRHIRAVIDPEQSTRSPTAAACRTSAVILVDEPARR